MNVRYSIHLRYRWDGRRRGKKRRSGAGVVFSTIVATSTVEEKFIRRVNAMS